MNDHGATSISAMKEAEDDEFLHSKQRDAKQGDHKQLDRAYFSQEGTVSDQRAGTAEVCVDQTLHSNVDFSCSEVEGVEPALHEKSPLQTKGGNQEVEAHSTEAVAFQEGHEETKSNKDHDVDILEAGISEVEVIFNVAGDVVTLPVLCPMCV